MNLRIQATTLTVTVLIMSAASAETSAPSGESDRTAAAARCPLARDALPVAARPTAAGGMSNGDW